MKIQPPRKNREPITTSKKSKPMRLIDDWKAELLRLWSVRVAAFWGAVGSIIVILSAYLYSSFNWWVGGLLILASVSFTVARVFKQPGTEQ